MKLQATQTVTLRLPAFQRVNVTLVGCGGTGSHLASGLGALALALGEQGKSARLLFMDPDTVEPKNVGRQLFTKSEIGLAKAPVLATRMGQAYGIAYEAVIRSIQASDTFTTPDALNLVIGAVDNAPARKLMAQACARANGQLWWLDCGNADHSGQIALGNAVDPQAWRTALGMVDSLPAPHVVYPDLIKAPKKQKRVSCADAVDAGDQGLMVNRMVAAWALSMLHDFLLGSLKYFTVDFDLTFGGVRSRALDEVTLKKISKGASHA